MNLVIPCGGMGRRFKEAGYDIPKPFIKINGKTMLEIVIDNLSNPADKVYLVTNPEFMPYFKDTTIFDRNNVAIIPEFSKPCGAATAVLLAEKFINSDEPLVIANADQYMKYHKTDWNRLLHGQEHTARIMTFSSDEPKWSYAKANRKGLVSEVAEKVVISKWATCGVYAWRNGQDFVTSAKQMIEKDIRVNGEFYVCPVYNEFIKSGGKVYIYPVEKMYGLGVPEDFERNKGLIV